MRIRNIIQLYQKHSVSVSGEKGSGKDLLTGNVIARRGIPYVSNIDYGGSWIPFKYSDIDIGNTYMDLISGSIKPYKYPFNDGTDIYLSDCGVYFPAQYCNELNKQFKSMPIFLALSRHLGECSVHTNAQALSRVWDKIREQSVSYILCLKVNKAILTLTKGKIVIQKIRIYDSYQSALEKRLPLRIKLPLGSKRASKDELRIRLDEYRSQHGEIKERTLIYWNKAKYDTRAFRGILAHENS